MASGQPVLIVEDDVNVAQLYSKKLELAGFQCEVAKTGTEGLAKALELSPAMILLDIRMPDMDGITMLKRLRADERGKNVPVVIVTNSIELEDLEEVAGLYSDCILKVDLELDDLVDKVRTCSGA